MQPNPIASLLKSRKFLIAVFDAFIGSLSLILGWFLAPDKVASIMTLFGLLQPVILLVIGSIAAEDVANMKASSDMYQADLNLAETKIYNAASKESKIPVPCDEVTELDK